jgi:2-oxo-4-hydroxy-4-carboxy-5-ureidoimidazoline decarboxylase
MTEKISLAALNQFNTEQFNATLGSIFEHSPWVAELSFEKRPFESIAHLHLVMLDAVKTAPQEQRMALICSHPELAGKEANAGTLTDESQKEQSSAGLNQCSTAELQQLQTLNRAYHHKFNFPFVIAVTGLNSSQIIAALETRLNNSIELEFNTSIIEIGKIGNIRLTALIDE